MIYSYNELKSIIFTYFKLFCKDSENIELDIEVLTHWVYGIDLEGKINNDQKESVYNALIKLKKLGLIKIKTEMMYRGNEQLPPKRYDTIMVWIKKGCIYNNRKNQFIELKKYY
jgi:hypothetical protein